MKGKKKQLLGFFGLALVFAMTAIAYSLPAPGAAAQDLNISVTVTAEAGSARIISPANGAVLTGRSTTVSVSYNKIRSMTTSLTCKNTGGEQVFQETRNATLTESTGVVNEAFTVAKDLGDVNCVAAMSSQGLDGEPYNDSVSFQFRPMSVVGSGKDEVNNPIVDVVVGDDVELVSIQAFDADGNPVFVDKDGKETPVLTKKEAFKDGKLSITLPMADYKAKPGKYVAYFTATNSKNEVISINEYSFEYVPIVETPGTGSIFKDLNLSRSDYLVTGLVAFGAVAGFAVYLVFRKSRR